jgi:hypothetical protein
MIAVKCAGALFVSRMARQPSGQESEAEADCGTWIDGLDRSCITRDSTPDAMEEKRLQVAEHMEARGRGPLQ